MGMEDLIISILKQVLLYVFGGIAGYYWQRYKASQEKEQALENAVQALLRDRILQIHHTCINEECISVLALDNAEKLYLQYQKLGGNGTVTQIMQDLRELQIKN